MGNTTVINSTTLLLGDKNYDGVATTGQTFIIYLVNNEPLRTYNASWGDFAIVGSSLASNQVLLSLTTLTYTNDWLVPIIVNGLTECYLSWSNVSTAGAIGGLNYTSYAYYYFDYSRNSGWPGPYNTSTPITNGGVTLASLANLAGVGTTTSYNMTLDTADGYGNSYSYSSVNINSNFTTIIENASLANVTMDPMADQPLLATTSGSGDSIAPLTYHQGPFISIMPGDTKKYYMKFISAIVYQANLGSLDLVKGVTSTMYNLAAIESYVSAGNITATNTTETINGQQYSVTGFNPLDLYYLNGWNAVWSVNYTNNMGSSAIINSTTLLLGDKNYDGVATSGETFLIYLVNN